MERVRIFGVVVDGGRIICYPFGVRKKLGVVFAMAVLLGACVSERISIWAPKPNEVMAKSSGHSLADLGEGYAIYLRKCAECHEHRVPTMIMNDQRHALVSGMSVNAGLSKREEAFLQKYLDSVADR